LIEGDKFAAHVNVLTIDGDRENRPPEIRTPCAVEAAAERVPVRAIPFHDVRAVGDVKRIGSINFRFCGSDREHVRETGQGNPVRAIPFGHARDATRVNSFAGCCERFCRKARPITQRRPVRPVPFYHEVCAHRTDFTETTTYIQVVSVDRHHTYANCNRSVPPFILRRGERAICRETSDIENEHYQSAHKSSGRHQLKDEVRNESGQFTVRSRQIH
jgi:hypothetical protein